METKELNLSELFGSEEANETSRSKKETKEQSTVDPREHEKRFVRRATRALEAAEKKCLENNRNYCAVYRGVREVLSITPSEGSSLPRDPGAQGAVGSPPDDGE